MITWDENKRKQVIKDHGVDFAKLADAFSDPLAIIEQDVQHSLNEERWLMIAKSAEYGLTVVVYTFREDDVRLVTARRAEKWMTGLYERQRNRS